MLIGMQTKVSRLEEENHQYRIKLGMELEIADSTLLYVRDNNHDEPSPRFSFRTPGEWRVFVPKERRFCICYSHPEVLFSNEGILGAGQNAKSPVSNDQLALPPGEFLIHISVKENTADGSGMLKIEALDSNGRVLTQVSKTGYDLTVFDSPMSSGNWVPGLIWKGTGDEPVELLRVRKGDFKRGPPDQLVASHGYMIWIQRCD